MEHVDIMPGFRSDHSLIRLDLRFETFERGPGFWKMNTTLLENQGFVDKLKIVVEDSLHYSTTLKDDQIWENLKFEISQFCKEQAEFRARE